MPALAIDQIILVSAALLGALALGYGIFAPGEARAEETRAPPAAPPWGGVAAGVVVAVLLFLGTLPGRPPFAPGSRLGIGVLVGAASAALLAALLGRLRPAAGSAPLIAAGGLSLLAVAGTMLAFRGSPADALFGVALGQALVVLFAAPGLRGGARAAGETLPLLSALLAAGVVLAIARYREFSAAERLALGEKLWWTGPLLVAGSLAVGQVAARALSRGAVARLGITAVAAAVVLGIFAASFPRYLPLLPAVGAGFVSGALLLALAAAPGGRGSALLGAGLALLLLVVAYRFLAGYGIVLGALGLAGAVLVAAPPAPTEAAEDLEPPALPLPLVALALLAFAALFRVFYVRYGLDETSVYLTAHYTLIGLIVGALAPLAVGVRSAECGVRNDEGAAARGGLLSGFGLLAVVFALPALMVVFWGIRACAGLVLGLALGQAYLLWLRLLEGDVGEGAAARLARAAGSAPVLLLAITCVQALSLFDDYAGLLTRTHRIAIVLAIAALFPIAILIRASAARRT